MASLPKPSGGRSKGSPGLTTLSGLGGGLNRGPSPPSTPPCSGDSFHTARYRATANLPSKSSSNAVPAATIFPSG
jgi:hypothetical protein